MALIEDPTKKLNATGKVKLAPLTGGVAGAVGTAGFNPNAGTAGTVKTAGAVQPAPLAPVPAYGSNVANFNPADANQVKIADIGQQWQAAAGNPKLQAQLHQQAEALRGGQGDYNPATGVHNLQAPISGEFGATEAQNDINAQIAAFQAQQAALQQQTQFGVQQNEQFLRDQLAGLGQQKNIDVDAAQQFQNRRGGFYSGGLDTQLGGIQRGFDTATSGLTRDIAQRNQQLLSQYGNQAGQIAGEIQRLQTTSPQLIRDRILEFQSKTAGLTGMFQGKPTYEAQQDTLNQQQQQEEMEYQRTRDSLLDERDKRNFDEDVRQFGLRMALDRQQEARIASGGGGGGSSGGGSAKPINLNTIIDNINPLFTRTDKDKGRIITDPMGLKKYILSIPNLTNEDLNQLYSIYGLVEEGDLEDEPVSGPLEVR